MKIARAFAACPVLVLAVASACSASVTPEGAGGSSSGSTTSASSSTTSASSSTTSASSSGAMQTACTNGLSCQSAGAGIHCYFDDPCFGWSIGCNLPPSCQADADCGSGESCRVCGHGTQLCVPACAKDADCGAGGSCDANHRCVPAPCQSDAQCPTYFTCSPTDQGCIRKTCQESADCGQGVCGDGHCYAAPGICTGCA
jgi:Cys-rich repeat protein